jgi:hypothetical protein
LGAAMGVIGGGMYVVGRGMMVMGRGNWLMVRTYSTDEIGKESNLCNNPIGYLAETWKNARLWLEGAGERRFEKSHNFCP